MNELVKMENENIKIEDMIYEIRGKQVMLDSDLAKLYNCKNGPKTINQAVKRHINRFPERFMFQLTYEDLKSLWSQIGTAKYNSMSRTLPYAFTEQGIAMLAAVLRTTVAEEISIQIMDAFVAMRKYISSNLIEQKYLYKQVLKNTDDIRLLQASFDKLQNNQSNSGLFFEGQIYDAHSLLLNLFETSKESITIIDNYLDRNILDVLRETDKEILIITSKYNNKDLDKYCKQYDNIEIKINNKMHDRFIIVDEKELYHCGASFKDLGNKCFALTKIENEEWLKEILKRI